MTLHVAPTIGDSAWYTEARFGLFIHWGIYALAGRGEWVIHNERIRADAYQTYFNHFDPDLYDPRVWAREAKNAGMRYFVVTAKHHDGFCLWDSQFTTYNAAQTPHGKDVLSPMVQAFRDEGMKVGLYYSLLDWHHPEYTIDGLHPQRDDLAFREHEQGRDFSIYRQYMFNQVRELLMRYHPEIFWFDFSYGERDYGWSRGKGKEDWHSEELMALVRSLQPSILVNDRLEIGGDIKTPEQYTPQSWMEVNGERVVWEACQTMNDNWGYHRRDHNWKSAEMLIKNLIDIVSKGGNYLLNVGPNGRGQLEPAALERLRGIGEWMRLHNRAIYGCTASEFTPPVDCRYTQNGNRLYLHLFSYPLRHIHLPGLADRVLYAQFLHDGSEVDRIVIDPHQEAQNLVMQGTPGTLTLELPAEKPPVAVPVVELFLK
jgi:alpha-L-fucosidase